ncbi:hypothetical protein [Gordonia malaquae]|uniref:hypothetical protein n=1 Tax=Gordonia malaquae TaxID=410332 RepID=UPI0030FF0C76
MSLNAIAIDPNLRIESNNTLAGFADVVAGSLDDLRGGLLVEVREVESGIVGDGQILRIDRARRLIELSVDWKSLHLAAY